MAQATDNAMGTAALFSAQGPGTAENEVEHGM